MAVKEAQVITCKMPEYGARVVNVIDLIIGNNDLVRSRERRNKIVLGSKL